MPHGFQRTWSCLPITALSRLPRCPINFLFSGHGSVIKIWDLSHEDEQQDVITREQVFESQSIHGIKGHTSSHHLSDAWSSFILIWGGRSIVLARFDFSLTTTSSECAKARLTIGPELQVAGWILDADFAIPSSAIANIAYLVTAHNSVFALQPKLSNQLDLNISRLASGPKSILYSAHIKPVSAGNILIAAGTVLGEVVLWQVHQNDEGVEGFEAEWCSHLCKVFHGHQGSIFGVSLSDLVRLSRHHAPQRYLASCSDDRTIRIWDVTSCDRIPRNCSATAGELSESASLKIQQANESTKFAVTWAHQSRIWGVAFLCGACARHQNLIVSRGEDATCQLWELRPDEPAASIEGSNLGSGRARLCQLSSDHSHSGKHIWSLACHCDGFALTVFTGGSDGAVIRKKSPTTQSRPCWGGIQVPFPELFKALECHVPSNELSGGRRSCSIKQYVFLASDTILAVTDSGQVIQGSFTAETSEADPRSIQWSHVFHSSELRGFAVMASDPEQQSAYIGSAVGNIWVYQLGMQEAQLLATVDVRIFNIFIGAPSFKYDVTSLQNVLVCANSSLTATLLHVSQRLHEPKTFQVSKFSHLNLPPTFQPTAFLDISNASQLVLGSRSGSLAVFQNIFDCNAISPVVCIRHVHHSDTVTCLRHLSTSYDNENSAIYHEILSTGRDGSYSIHRMSLKHLSDVTLTTLHQALPPFGPYIEGADVITTDAGSAGILLYGFNGKNFVLWDESSNHEVVTMPCGGAHRSWAFISHHVPAGQKTPSQAACFVWTKAGVLNMTKFNGPPCTPVQKGGHGREIKAMALSTDRLCHGSSGAALTQLIATGAEDTSIRLWHLKTDANKAEADIPVLSWRDTVLCTRVLKRHTTGLQQLAFCKTYLFSSSGFEELFIWKINTGVACVGTGVVFQAALPKHKKVSDLRITSFEVHSDPREETGPGLNSDSFLIYAAYSDSMVRVFRYSNDNRSTAHDRFHLLGEGFYNRTCLTQLLLMPHRCPWFLTAGTNGAIAVWPDVRNFLEEKETAVGLSHVAEFFVHQNAVLALRLIPIAPGYHLLVTCGDDNAIGISVISESCSHRRASCSSQSDGARPQLKFGTLLIPKAHAAAVTAIEILDCRRKGRVSILTVASIGNDQLVKIWRITVDNDELSKSGIPGIAEDDPDHAFGQAVNCSIDVQLSKHIWSNVADASSIILIPDEVDTVVATDTANSGKFGKERHGCRIIVAGIGMEMLWIDLEEANSRVKSPETVQDDP